MKSTRITRRGFVKTAVLSAGALASPVFLRRAYAATPLSVGTFGGYFEEQVKEKVLPLFTEATGIPTQSIPISSGAPFFNGMRPAVEAGDPPMDVVMAGGGEIIKFNELFHRNDASALPNSWHLGDGFVSADGDGRVYAVAVLAWYQIFAQNTEYFPDPIQSWAEIWDPKFNNSLAIADDITDNGLLEITAHTFFGGDEALNTKEGAMEVMKKALELKGNVTLWYGDEGQFESALKTGEIPAGTYYHDVAQLLIADGFPIASVFPKEGGLIDFGSWSILRNSKNIDAAQQFLNFCCDPKVQGDMSRGIGTAPVVSQEAAGMTDEEFALVSSPIEPIFPNYKFQVELADWANEEWNKMLAAG
ncbi:PotD/PotF family extracellular solute-binding protein [Ruegeria sp. EL01]|jgi:putative spermidine/putrescine transport system substrate-binding protein|uniref:ABC transporter substrate-binding protein n=1 Tax=Ruegeria sp. EL01 TaxID=2107578 RepID=UPI000EA82379|nr:extracellular solute-binding protein [Ruegeria sp. EL01]